MEQGYRAVTTRQIADACGLTQPALYHYFADKHDLYVAVMQEELAKSKAALERIARRNENIEERLRLVARYMLSQASHNHSLMLHDIRYEIAPEQQKILQAAFQASIIAPIASIFEEGIQSGFLYDARHTGSNATMATHLFLSMLSRFAGPAQTNEKTIANSSERADIVVNIVLYGLVRHDLTKQQP